MENQHRKIKGYRELCADEIDLMNKVKSLGEELGKLHTQLQVYQSETGNHAIDPRWLAEGKTDLQKGIMCWVRSIARPESF